MVFDPFEATTRARPEDEMIWMPIDSAPRDGSYILITDGSRFAAAEPFDYTEPAELGHGPSGTLRPNPDAGKVRLLWHTVGCSGFTSDADVYDYDGPIWIGNKATHWMPLPEPPTPRFYNNTFIGEQHLILNV